MIKSKKPQFATPYKYVKSKKDKLYNNTSKAITMPTEQQRVKQEGRS